MNKIERAHKLRQRVWEDFACQKITFDEVKRQLGNIAAYQALTDSDLISVLEDRE